MIDQLGYAQGPATTKSAGQTPYGFASASDGALVVSEAFGGAKGAAAASSYAVSGAELQLISGSIGDTRSEVCWVVITEDDRFAYVTNFGDGTVSSYEIAADRSLKLSDPVAGLTSRNDKGLRDEALSADGRYLYAIDPDAQKLFAWAVDQDGQLKPAGEYGGIPTTLAAPRGELKYPARMLRGSAPGGRVRCVHDFASPLGCPGTCARSPCTRHSKKAPPVAGRGL